MAEEKKHKLVDWENPAASPGLGKKALENGDFWFETGENTHEVKLVGFCPRCYACLDRVFYGDSVFTLRDAAKKKKREPTVRVVECQCGFKHPNAPSDAPGCGMATTVKLDL